jgi:hypothetical protein
VQRRIDGPFSKFDQATNRSLNSRRDKSKRLCRWNQKASQLEDASRAAKAGGQKVCWN